MEIAQIRRELSSQITSAHGFLFCHQCLMQTDRAVEDLTPLRMLCVSVVVGVQC